MAVPKKRHTKSKTRSKRSHHAMSRIHLAKCKQCGARTMPHQACPECGTYSTRNKKTAEKPETDTAKEADPSK